jgi:hypothetical protein
MNKPLIKTFDEILSDLIPLLDMTDDTAKSVLKAKKEKLFKAVQARDTGVLGENRKTPSKKRIIKVVLLMAVSYSEKKLNSAWKRREDRFQQTGVNLCQNSKKNKLNG